MKAFYAVEIKLKNKFRRIFPKKIPSKQRANRFYEEKVISNPNKTVRLVCIDEFGERVEKISS